MGTTHKMKALSRGNAAFLSDISPSIVPQIADLDSQKLEKFLATIDEFLMSRPPKLRRQFGVFLKVLRFMPLARYGKTLEKLDENRREKVMLKVQDFPNLLIRRGFWGLKSLVFVGYYGGLEPGPSIYYTPSLNGNDKLNV